MVSGWWATALGSDWVWAIAAGSAVVITIERCINWGAPGSAGAAGKMRIVMALFIRARVAGSTIRHVRSAVEAARERCLIR